MLSTKDLKDLFGENSPDKVILKAQKLSAKGRNDQAIEVIKEAIGRLGENPDLRIEMTTLNLGSGRMREAAECLRALLKSDPSQVSRVEEYLGWARTQFSDTEALHEPMAEGHIARRNFTAAMDYLERINRKTLEISLESRLVNLNRFLDKGTLVPKSALPALYFAALSYEAINDWQKAVDTYRRILTAAPGDFATVDERLKAMVARNYKVTSLRLAYAGLLDGLSHPDRARDEYLKALEVDPRCASHVARYLEGLLKAQPDNDDLTWSMVRVLLAEGKQPEEMELCGRLADRRSHLAEIEKMLEEISGTGKDTVDTRLLLARVAVAQGKAQRAVAAIVSAMGDEAGARGIAALEMVIEAFPNESRPYQILADCHLKEGRVDKCLEAYRALRRVDPASSTTIATRLSAVVAADPANTAARDLLEEVCVESGDIKGAVPFLRRRLRHSPEAARDVAARLKPMLMSAPGDDGLRLAAAEAHAMAGEAATAWGYLQDLIEPTKPAETAHLRLLVVCAGASPEMFRKVTTFFAARAARWSEQPEVVFALAEAAGRASEIREAVTRFRKAAAAAPEATAICHESIRNLARQDHKTRGGEELAALAEALLDVGDLAAATECLRGAGAMPPAVAGRLVERFSAALKSDPKNIALSTGLAGVCVASGQTARALEIARAGLTGREDAASAPLTMIYGDALSRAGKPAEATRAYAAAAKRDPALSPEVIQRLQHVIQVDMGLETAHLALGRLLVNEGRVAEGVAALATAWSIQSELGPTVLKDLERTARKHPGDVSVDFVRSQILLETGDPVGAADALSGHIGSDPVRLNEILTRLEAIAGRHATCARAQVELGRAYLARGWAARACASFVKAHRLDASLSSLIAGPLAQIQKQFPDEPEAYNARGAIYEAEGKLVPAAEAYQKAASLGGVRGAGALDGLRRLCESGADVPGAVHLMRARSCRVVGEVHEAVQASRRALDAGDSAAAVRAELDLLVAAHPTSAVAWLGRAAACVKLQDHESAALDLCEALRLDPASSDSVIALARQILEVRPSFAPAARALADALLATGDTAGAARAIDMALATPEAGSDLELILARREMALQTGDTGAAAALLARAEKSAGDRDAFLERLHREALRQPGAPIAEQDGPVAALVARGEYARALEMLAAEPASPRKAWVLDRCGRHLEAAACLGQLAADDRLAAAYATLLNRMVARELEGRAGCLTGETTIEFEVLATIDRKPSRQRQAGEAAMGGAR